MARTKTAKFVIGKYVVTVAEKQIRIFEEGELSKKQILKWRISQYGTEPSRGKVYMAATPGGGWSRTTITTFTLQEMRYTMNHQLGIQIPQEAFDIFESRMLAERMIANG